MIDLHFEWPDGRRKRIRRVSPVQTRHGAEKYERKIRAALLDGSYRSKRNLAPTIAEYLTDYLRDLHSRGRKPTTLASAEGLFRNWVVPSVGHRRIDERAEDIFAAEPWAECLRWCSAKKTSCNRQPKSGGPVGPNRGGVDPPSRGRPRLRRISGSVESRAPLV